MSSREANPFTSSSLPSCFGHHQTTDSQWEFRDPRLLDSPLDKENWKDAFRVSCLSILPSSCAPCFQLIIESLSFASVPRPLPLLLLSHVLLVSWDYPPSGVALLMSSFSSLNLTWGVRRLATESIIPCKRCFLYCSSSPIHPFHGKWGCG